MKLACHRPEGLIGWKIASWLGHGIVVIGLDAQAFILFKNTIKSKDDSIATQVANTCWNTILG